MTEKMKHRFTPNEINQLPGREVKSKRTRASKTYALGNGLYQAVIYPEDVHFRNSQGEWEDIDHTLKKEHNVLCDHSGELSVAVGSAGEVTLTKGSHTLSWQIIGAAAVEAQADNRRPKFPRHNEQLRTENKIVYSDIFQDVDFICEIQPNRFKDTFVFKNANALRPVEFLIRTTNVTLQQAADGTVFAMDAKGVIFRLPAPCLIDAHGCAIPNSASAVLTPIGENTWHLLYKVDDKYVKNAEYPLRLDPLVETQQTKAAMSLYCTSSRAPDTEYAATEYTTLISANDSSYGKCRLYLRFHDRDDIEDGNQTEEEIAEQVALPIIDASYYITSATLYLRTTYEGASTHIYVHELKNPWPQTPITHNNQPETYEEPIEYCLASTIKNYTLPFNITNLVRKWYNGNNNGLMLETQNGGSVYVGGTGATYHKPYMIINYISLAGLESYLQQDSIGCGRAGTAYVGLFNGNLVFSHQETSMNGNLLPVSIDRYYNSCYHDINAFHAGNGWKFSTQQTLHKETIDSTVHYVYMDGDGTRHFFKKTDGKWKDLSGRQLTMKINGSTASISDKGGNKMNFPLPTNEFLVDGKENYANVTWITSIENACGTKDEFVHSKATSGDFAMAKDGAGRSTTATVNAALMVTKLQSPGMNPVLYEYNAAEQLTKITHPDSTVTEYGYNSKGLLASITNCDESGIRIIYQNGIADRVKEIQMLDKNQAVYAIRRYEYGNCCTTIVESYREVAADGSIQYVDGKPAHYHFNDAGNLVSVNDDLGYGYFAGYSDDVPANHPAYLSKLQGTVTNYLKNHHFITVNNDWTVEKKNGTGDCSYSSDNNYIGGRAYKMKKTNSDGYISIYQTVTLKDGADYTFSCQYQTLNSARVQLQAETASGVLIKASVPMKCTDRWNRTHLSFTVPKTSAEDAVTYTNVILRIMAVGEPGTVWVDAAQLEDGLIPNRYNLLENGSFYMNDSGRPLYWTKGDATTDDDGVTTDIAPGRPSELSGNAVRLYGAPGIMKSFTQLVPSIGHAGDTFVAGGWSWSHCRPRATDSDCQYEMEISARHYAEDGKGAWETVGRVQWSEEWSGWQFASIPIVIKFRYSDIYVQLIYRNNLNEAQFSNLFLHKEEFGKTFEYDDNGNIDKVRNLAGLQSGSEYDAFDNLVSYQQPGRSEKYRMNWGSTDADKQKHLLRKMTSPLNIIQRTVYDTRTATAENPATTFGLPEKTYAEATFVNDEGNTCRRFIAAETGYTADKNYVSTSTDARNKVVTTATDPNRGIVNSVTDPKGQSVSYTYDTLNRVTKVSTTAAGAEFRNQYVYEDDLLKQVRHNTSANEAEDVVYSFEYDSKNRRTGVKVGNHYLSKNEYDDTPGPKYGILARSIYCNSDENPQVVHYSYDDFKRMTSIRYGDESENKRYSFEYDANGQVALVTNHELNRTILSEHDKCSRPMRITHMEGNNHVYTGEVTYDEYSNLARFEESVGSARTAYSTAFTYDVENKPTLLKYNDSSADKVAYTYDELGRTAKRTVTVNGHASETNYVYLAGAQTYTPEDVDDDKPTYATTGLIESITQPGGNFTYTYDDNGNISSVVQDGVTTAYTYDALGQLIRVDDGQENATWVYTYDQGGNILSKKKYALNVTSGTPVESKTFTYGNANWKDQLTAVNGIPITYDNIGNPLNDGTWTYTWEKGRQLKSMSKSGTTASFKYNENGLRIQKTVNGVVTNYTLHGKNIVHMTQGSNTLHFFYDASNKPAIVDFNGTKYGYVQNLQGDVVALVDSTGSVVVYYKYDAWGRPISKTGSMASTLGTVQPFRYRGYVYDEETGLYYLRSRCYNPTSCRFVNGDILIGNGTLLSHNLFAYCSNQVVCSADTSGLEKTTSIWYIRCAPNEVITLSYGVTVKRGDVITSVAATGDNVHSIITLADGRKCEIENFYITGLEPLGIADVYGVPEMGPGKELDSEHVMNLQRDLLTLGYYKGRIDGQYGEKTMAAVVAFGKDEGLGTGTYAGPKVKNRLFERMYAQYDHAQDEENQRYWDGYNAFRQEMTERLRNRTLERISR